MFTSSVGSQQSTVPKGLPMLPGNGFKDPTLLDFKKSHVFDVHQGIPVAHDPNVVAPAATSGAAEEIEAPKMPPMPTADITPVQPAWVAFDRKVLRFNCFFKEVRAAGSTDTTPLFSSCFLRPRRLSLGCPSPIRRR